MDVGATSLNKGTDNVVESKITQSLANSDTKLQHISSSLQGSVVTSRLSSLLSSLVAEPLAAAPRMPQHQTPRNASVGEKASLPQPLASPSFPVPPHIMGRNVNNPVEDSGVHGRRLQKPRLGVKVPYRNLTSQIVTQDELAQELLERSLKKHPVRDVPEGGDLFFAIKLTQRLANRLSPGKSQTTEVGGQSSGKSSQPQTPLSTDEKSSVRSKQPSPGGNLAIADNNDLLAILEGDGEVDWIPKPLSTSTVATTPVQHITLPSLPQIAHVKLDPMLERELALKQLMEFQNSSRRRKSDKGQKPEAGKPGRKPRSKVSKVPLNKENGTVVRKRKLVKDVGPQRNSRSSNVIRSGVSNNIRSPTEVMKGTRKRKLDDSSPREIKKPRISGRKAAIDKTNALVKTEDPVLKKRKTKSVSPSNNNNNNNKVKKGEKRSPFKGAGSEQVTKCVPVNKPKKSRSPSVSVKVEPNVSDSTPGGSSTGRKASPSNSEKGLHRNKKDSLTQNSFTQNSSLIDDFPEFPRSFTTPIRTYSPKKRIPSTVNSSNVQASELQLIPKEEPTNETNIACESKIIVDKVADASHPSPQNQSPSNNDTVPKNVKENADSKKRRMREIDRLLMDEGAINLLYEAERDSRRRSNVNEDAEVTIVSQEKVLKSVRRKKKDLLLKTRLVKNAVLRLTNSPLISAASVTARITRQSDTPTMPSTSVEQSSDSGRKISVDSVESLRSPPPLTPNDPSSPQSFIYPGRLPLPAEASRIIRRHSSSSNFSSRSASPSNNRLVDVPQTSETSGKVIEKLQLSAGAVTSGNVAKSAVSVSRKKGVPIFIRKPQVIHTYQGKKKKYPPVEEKNSDLPDKELNKVSQQNNKDVKTVSKAQGPKVTAEKKKVVVKKITLADKLKLKAEMTKNFQKGFQSKKVNLKKSAENETVKTKKDETVKAISGASNNSNGSIVDKMLDLTSCLAAAASAFAAEAQEVREGKGSKKSGSSNTSLASSPCPSRSSKSPTPTNRSTGKKGIPPPLSPNAATYSNLLKTLENEGQKPRKKDGEELIKQRSSVRQNTGAYHYKDISLRRYDNMVQVILTPQSTKMKNALNLQVLRELKDALNQLKKDETCRVVLLTSTGSTFCQGIDFYSLLQTNVEKRKAAAQELAQALKEFMKSLALFSKPIVAGVHGPAVGLGVTMLPFFDMIFASDKSTFYTPYAKLGQVPEGAAILTLPHMFGNAVTSELLFGCRKLTASEALHFGLVTRILWPDRFQEELIPIIRNMASQSPQSMEATKALLRHNVRTKLEAALESETHLLVQHWISSECQTNFKKFLEDEDVGLQKQRVET